MNFAESSEPTILAGLRFHSVSWITSPIFLPWIDRSSRFTNLKTLHKLKLGLQSAGLLDRLKYCCHVFRLNPKSI